MRGYLACRDPPDFDEEKQAKFWNGRKADNAGVLMNSLSCANKYHTAETEFHQKMIGELILRKQFHGRNAHSIISLTAGVCRVEREFFPRDKLEMLTAIDVNNTMAVSTRKHYKARVFKEDEIAYKKMFQYIVHKFGSDRPSLLKLYQSIKKKEIKYNFLLANFFTQNLAEDAVVWNLRAMGKLMDAGAVAYFKDVMIEGDFEKESMLAPGFQIHRTVPRIMSLIGAGLGPEWKEINREYFKTDNFGKEVASIWFKVLSKSDEGQLTLIEEHMENAKDWRKLYYEAEKKFKR